MTAPACSTCKGLSYVRRCVFACPDDCRDHSVSCPACVTDPFDGLYGQHDGEHTPTRINPSEWVDKIPSQPATRKVPPMPAHHPSPGLDRIRRAEMDDLVHRIRTARRASAPMILTARETELVADVLDNLAEAPE